MLAGFLIGLFTSIIPIITISDFGIRLAVIVLITTVVWVIVMLITPPESEATLLRFYQKVKPGGPGWKKYQELTGQEAKPLRFVIYRVIAAAMVLFGSMFGIGALLLYKFPLALWMAGLTGCGFLLLNRMKNL